MEFSKLIDNPCVKCSPPTSQRLFVIQKMSYKRRKLLTINGMLIMSQLIIHSSYYSEKMLMHLTVQTVYTCIIKSLLLPAVALKRKAGSIFSWSFSPNFRENVHDFRCPCFSRTQAASTCPIEWTPLYTGTEMWFSKSFASSNDHLANRN